MYFDTVSTLHSLIWGLKDTGWLHFL